MQEKGEWYNLAVLKMYILFSINVVRVRAAHLGDTVYYGES